MHTTIKVHRHHLLTNPATNSITNQNTSKYKINHISSSILKNIQQKIQFFFFNIIFDELYHHHYHHLSFSNEQDVREKERATRGMGDRKFSLIGEILGTSTTSTKSSHLRYKVDDAPIARNAPSSINYSNDEIRKSLKSSINYDTMTSYEIEQANGFHSNASGLYSGVSSNSSSSRNTPSVLPPPSSNHPSSKVTAVRSALNRKQSTRTNGVNYRSSLDSVGEQEDDGTSDLLRSASTLYQSNQISKENYEQVRNAIVRGDAAIVNAFKGYVAAQM